jgi:hypothetical protein
MPVFENIFVKLSFIKTILNYFSLANSKNLPVFALSP